MITYGLLTGGFWEQPYVPFYLRTTLIQHLRGHNHPVHLKPEDSISLGAPTALIQIQLRLPPKKGPVTREIERRKSIKDWKKCQSWDEFEEFVAIHHPAFLDFSRPSSRLGLVGITAQKPEVTSAKGLSTKLLKSSLKCACNTLSWVASSWDLIPFGTKHREFRAKRVNPSLQISSEQFAALQFSEFIEDYSPSTLDNRSMTDTSSPHVLREEHRDEAIRREIEPSKDTDNVSDLSTEDKSKQTHRTALKLRSPKAPGRVVLRAKAKDEPKVTQPTSFAVRQRHVREAVTSSSSSPTTPKTRAGNSLRANNSSCQSSGIPTRIAHHSKIASAPRAIKSAGNSPAIQRRENVKHYRARRIVPDEKSTSTDVSRGDSSRQQDRENREFEHLGEPSDITGPNSFLIKVLPDQAPNEEVQMPNWELVDYPRPITPQLISITPISDLTESASANDADLESQIEQSQDYQGVPQDLAVTKLLQAEHDHSFPTAANGKGLAKAEDASGSFESKIRSIITNHDLHPRQRFRTGSHDLIKSVKSVAFDPSIISIGPKTSHKRQSAARRTSKLTGSSNLFEKSLKELNKKDRRALAKLLEALKNIESDEDSDIVPAEEKNDLGLSDGNISVFNHGSYQFLDIEHVPEINGTGTLAQKSYAEVLASPMRPTHKSVPESPNPASRNPALVGSETQDSTQRAQRRLNPNAPAFNSLARSKLRATQSDPLQDAIRSNDTPPVVESLRKHMSRSEEVSAKLPRSAPAKAGKYIPPALRGDHKIYQSDIQTQEPVWLKVRSNRSPTRKPEPSHRINTYERNPRPPGTWWHGPAGSLPQNNDIDRENQERWLTQWLHDAAKPDHGSGIGDTIGSRQVSYDYRPREQILGGPPLPSQVHGDTPVLANNVFGAMPPLDWSRLEHYVLHQPSPPPGMLPLWPYSLGTPLVPILPPQFQSSQPYLPVLPQQNLVSVPRPLVAEPAYLAPSRSSQRVKLARSANALDSAWGDKVLDKFVSKFPMTGKCQSNFPVPPIQDLETKPARIQQKLELLLLQQKEKQAFKNRLKAIS